MATPEQSLQVAMKTDLDNATPYLEALLRSPELVESYKQMAQLAAARNPDLIRKCERRSFPLAILWCAQRGLEPGVEDGAWLIPFNGRVTPIAAYKGLIKRLVQSGSVLEVDAQVVYMNDFFEYELGLNPDLRHRPEKLGKDRGPVIGYYSVFKMPDGSKRFHVMDVPAIEKIRNSSAAWKGQSNKGPWEEWQDAMALKTVIKQGLKFIPVTSSVRDVLVEDSRIISGHDIQHVLREGGMEIPPELEAPPEPEKPKETKEEVADKFNSLVTGKTGHLTPQKLSACREALANFVSAIAAAQKPKASVPQVEAKAVEKFDEFWTAFLTRGGGKVFFEPEPVNAPGEGGPAEKAEEERDEEPEGEESEGTVVVTPEVDDQSIKERIQAIMSTMVEKGCAWSEFAKIGLKGVTGPGAITPENVEEVERFVAGFEGRKKGRK